MTRFGSAFSLFFGATALCALHGCYSTGDGTAPPTKSLYFPVGLAVSTGGNVLYVANSDFDLQYNGGTLQSYDLGLIRQHAQIAIANPTDSRLPLVARGATSGVNPCPSAPPIWKPDGSGARQPLGETCSPPVDSSFYVRDSAILGAFSTDLQLSLSGGRLFSPVRGDASLSWADVAADDASQSGASASLTAFAPYALDCGVRVSGRCNADHQAGNRADEPGNSRQITMPGEPFGMAQTADGEAIVVTHQTDTKSSLFATGLSATRTATSPSLQFVADGVAAGGNGIAAIPHDPDALGPCPSNPQAACREHPPRPAFLQTSRYVAEIDLLRYYSDEGDSARSSLARPFVSLERKYPITANASGTDSRAIVIDPTPRIACKLNVLPASSSSNPPRTDQMVADELLACARIPARVFIANRSPASILVGEVGWTASDGTYDPDRLVLSGSVPLSSGPSRLYLAPIVDKDGRYALRLFVTCYDASMVFVYDPGARRVENVIWVGPGPFALAFDPFRWEDVARRAKVEADNRAGFDGLLRYRFAYVASFTNSYIQILDLDDARADKSTFERVVYTLGAPTRPKGT